MTLNEYLNQTEPERNAEVLLDETEYIQRGTFKAGPARYYTYYEIPLIAEKYGIEDCYGQFNGGKILFSPHGVTGVVDFTRPSVFRLPENSNKHPEIVLLRAFLSAHQNFINEWIDANPDTDDLFNDTFHRKHSDFLNNVKDEYQLTEEDIYHRQNCY